MASTTSTNGFILAGGLGRRMGRDKAELAWGRGSLLDHMVRVLSTVASPVRVVGRGDFPDRIPGQGPLGGILTALEASETEKNLILAVDLPLLTPAFLQLFQRRFAETPQPVLACRIADSYPLCLGIDRNCLPDVAVRIEAGNLALHRFIAETPSEIIEEQDLLKLGHDPSIFSNANTPQDWAKLQ